MKILFLLLTFLLSSMVGSVISSVAMAQVDFAVTAGVRSNWSDTSVPGATVTSRVGYQAGVLGIANLKDNFAIRSGFNYVQRDITLGPTTSGNIDVNYAYFDVPLTVAYHINDAAWVFGGPVLSFNQSKDVTCSSNAMCSDKNVKSFLVPWQIGVGGRFLPQVGGEFYFEDTPGSLSDSISDMRAIVVSLLIFFE